MEHITEILLDDYLDKRYRGILYELENYIKYRDKIIGFSKFLKRIPIKKKIFDKEFQYIAFIISDGDVFLCLNVRYMNSGRPKECICINKDGDIIKIPIRKIRTFNNTVFKPVKIWDYENKEVRVVDTSAIVVNNEPDKFSMENNIIDKYLRIING